MNFMLVFEQNDPVLISTFLLLILMSSITWFVILLRGFVFLRTRAAIKREIALFWKSKDLTSARKAVEKSNQPVGRMAKAGLHALDEFHDNEKTFAEACGLDDYLVRCIRNALNLETQRLEGGMTVLASIGSTAPFVGLFGTVWGIYHALLAIASSGQATLDAVAGPMGEALVATAAGLFAAIPAVLAYNTFVRGNKVVQNHLDSFAHDLHHSLLAFGSK
ncbi:MotA/TolQ/ExbB proton channel family protein [Permianibacter sp. IMCC34836]|uniref:MotA/TolQ/ExbB proton channel family protein n=1 Tax=Permianibacter fluminis TaxID=2738515 RepID=UPI0015578B7C|nr:MotA/TolQ/ExbB proton channel family protein [Permianibacter fluminis]NQD38976.1 MotA/TolQ/ExbB proton channel family protein [Permianibacter fluminis]